MKDTSSYMNVQLLTKIYVAYRPVVFRYVSRRLNGSAEAEDLVQDAFLRLLEYCPLLRPDAVRSFLYTVVRNLLTDYLRRYYKKKEVMAYIQEGFSVSVNNVEDKAIAKDLLLQEKVVLRRLPPKTKVIYSKSRFDEKTVSEISLELNLSKRTVEGCLLKGRKVIRGYMKQCI